MRASFRLTTRVFVRRPLLPRLVSAYGGVVAPVNLRLISDVGC